MAGATSVITRKTNNGFEVLMVREKRAWKCVTGNIPRGETILQGALRESEEEVSLKVEPFALLGLYNKTRAGRTNDIHLVFATRLLNATDGDKIVIQEDEIIEAKWCILDELLKSQSRGSGMSVDARTLPWLRSLKCHLETNAGFKIVTRNMGKSGTMIMA
eukprot:CAMPEP_0168537286 /NCGR_PEP_ID=MMETSP0405-20121227/20212_1 /TAXON_ID=498012 /ORGANISM="Trichosphaerium sp, Strain Am-I-7 wt" /LENGTH=160 /DNA_ID=CAMNT_0008565769 /DNA_START=141 /DNA_END=620 /DNA_ORIENTATION=+